MIFKKILKGTDLSFDINLDKREYKLGETVKGTLTLMTNKGSKARQLMLFAEGKESTIIKVSESSGSSSSSSSHTTTRTYSETNTFFSEDLSDLLQKSISSKILPDGTLEILPQNKETAFDFTLPTHDNLFSSYNGKHANITYTVKSTVDIAKRLDVNKEELFTVINPNKKAVYNSDVSLFNDNKSNATTTMENNLSSSSIIEGEESIGKESYSSRFERIFGKKAGRTTSSRRRYFTFSGTGINFDLGTLFTKSREHFTKENSEAKFELLDSINTYYSPGQSIKGKVKLLQEQDPNGKKKIRGMKIILSGIEHAFAKGLQRVTTIEKYEQNIELNGKNDNDQNNTIPFEIRIPHDANQSYIGKYSEYFWGLEAKVNMAWSSDVHARTIIEIV